MPTLASERRITVYLSVEEIAAIDAFRAAHGLASRSAAVSELLRRGSRLRSRRHSFEQSSNKTTQSCRTKIELIRLGQSVRRSVNSISAR